MGPTAGGFVYVLTCVDALTRFTMLEALSAASGAEVVRALELMVCNFSVAPRVRSGNRSHFDNRTVRDWCARRGVERRFYDPQGMGAAEVRHRVLGERMRASLLVRAGEGVEWPALMKRLQYAMNTRYCAASSAACRPSG